MGIPIEQVHRGQGALHPLRSPALAGERALQRLRELVELVQALGRELDAPPSPVHAEIHSRVQGPRQAERRLDGGRVGRGSTAREDERRAGIVDQHAVGLVDDGEAKAAEHRGLAAGLGAPGEPARELRRVGQGQAIPQVVEGHLLVGHVGHVAGIRVAARAPLLLFLDDGSGRETETPVERAPWRRRRATPDSRWP